MRYEANGYAGQAENFFIIDKQRGQTNKGVRTL
jgi:hypothetical protein